MHSRIPTQALRKLMLGVQGPKFSDLVPVPVIPVTESRWLASVEDSILPSGIETLNRLVDSLTSSIASAQAGDIKRLSVLIGGHLDDLYVDLDCLRFFALVGKDDFSGINELLDGVRSRLVELTFDDDLTKLLNEASMLVDRFLLQSECYVADPVQAAFGVPLDILISDRQVVESTRLLAQYYGRYDELDRRVASILAAASMTEFQLVENVQHALAIVVCSRPLFLLRTAKGVDVMAESALRHPDVDARVAALRKIRSRVDMSSANHKRTIDANLRRKDSDAEADVAAVALDNYRRTAEGQLRPAVWGLLGLAGRVESAQRLPELGPLRDQLVAAKTRLFDDAASAIHPVLRNAAAHEDFLWDDEAGQIILGETRTSIDAVDRASERAYHFMMGSEVGIACAQYKSQHLFDALRQDDPKDGYRAFREQQALAIFGTNGATVHDWSHNAGTFSVTISPVEATKFSPIFQALMWAANFLSGTGRFVVRVVEREAAVVDVSREPLELLYHVWLASRQWSSAMIPSVFLPVNAAARLRVETVDICMRAIAWLAVNDMMHAMIAYDDHLHVSVRERSEAELEFARSLRVIGASVSATSTLFDAPGPLVDVQALIKDGLREMGKRPKDRPYRWLKMYRNRMQNLYESWPAVAIVPTLDPSPLTDVE